MIHTRVFAAEPGGGNPCPVVPDSDGLDGALMQRIARHYSLDTAFICRSTSNVSDLRIRYFVPHHEMGVSGHATIAALTVALGREPNLRGMRGGVLEIETISGVFRARWDRAQGVIRITLAQNRPEFGPEIPASDVTHALGIAVGEIDTSRSPVQSVSVSRAKLVVPIRNSSALNRISPDCEAMSRLCEQQNVTGLYPFTRGTDKPGADVEARQFPYRAGFCEDAATGVAAAALGAYLVRYDRRCRDERSEFRVAQGYAMGAPSLIIARADCAGGVIGTTAICGSAQVLHSEELDF